MPKLYHYSEIHSHKNELYSGEYPNTFAILTYHNRVVCIVIINKYYN